MYPMQVDRYKGRHYFNTLRVGSLVPLIIHFHVSNRVEVLKSCNFIRELLVEYMQEQILRNDEHSFNQFTRNETFYKSNKNYLYNMLIYIFFNLMTQNWFPYFT